MSNIRPEDHDLRYLGILKCPTCGSYSHFLLEEHGMALCCACGAAFLPQGRLPRTGGQSWKAAHRQGGRLWSFYVGRSREFMKSMEGVPEEAIEDTLGDFLLQLRREGEQAHPHPLAENLFTSFFQWFCEEFAIPSQDEPPH